MTGWTINGTRCQHTATGTRARLRELPNGQWEASIRHTSPARVRTSVGTLDEVQAWLNRNVTYAPTL